MSEEQGWLVAVKGWERMATRPKPFHARTPVERDWYLRNSGSPERYDVIPVDDIDAETRAQLGFDDPR